MTDIGYLFTQLGFLIRGYLMRLGLTQGIWHEFKTAEQQSAAANAWFSPQSVRLALCAIAQEMLQPSKFMAWLAKYSLKNVKESKKIGIIMAGNLPLAGFHDFLCVLCSGHTAVVKLSSKDQFLLPMLVRLMTKINYRVGEYAFFVPAIDAAMVSAVIATGSDSSAICFEQKYGCLPHIFRRSRTSAAVLTGSENAEDLHGLAHDILDYCGLGCRSVSKLFVPMDYDFSHLQSALADFKHDNRYFTDAYRYAKALCIASQAQFVDCACCILQCGNAGSPLSAQVFYEYYYDEDDLRQKLIVQPPLQCLVGARPIVNYESVHAAFGAAQRPQLTDYADGIDTMKWLASIF
jgi:hypothetical protein